jgi:hypothetical protein
VHLKNFSLLSPNIQNADLLKAIEMAIPATAIEEAIALHSKRRRTQAIITSTIGCKPFVAGFHPRSGFLQVCSRLDLRSPNDRGS